MCTNLHIERCNVATNLALDDNLIRQAQKVSGLKTKKDTVNQALLEFIQRHKIEDLISEFGTIEFDENYDYKKERIAR